MSAWLVMDNHTPYEVPLGGIYRITGNGQPVEINLAPGQMVSVPSGTVVTNITPIEYYMNYDPKELDRASGEGMFGEWGESNKSTKLLCRCWVCQKDISPYQLYDFTTGKEKVKMNCCGREEEILLSEEEIKKSNESGVYQAFMMGGKIL